MENYKKGKNVEEELLRDKIPIENLPENFLWMHVKGGTKISNVIEFAEKAFKANECRSVVWSGSGGGVQKTISCAEILKRQFEFHQVTRIAYQKIEEYWDPVLKGLDQIVVTRRVPAIHILLSLDKVENNVLGYQDSKLATSFWTGTNEKQSPGNYLYNKTRNYHQNRSKYKSNNVREEKKKSS